MDDLVDEPDGFESIVLIVVQLEMNALSVCALRGLQFLEARIEHIRSVIVVL